MPCPGCTAAALPDVVAGGVLWLCARRCEEEDVDMTEEAKELLTRIGAHAF